MPCCSCGGPLHQIQVGTQPSSGKPNPMIKRGGPIIKIPLLPFGKFPCPNQWEKGDLACLAAPVVAPSTRSRENPTQVRQALPMIKIPNKKEQGNI